MLTAGKCCLIRPCFSFRVPLHQGRFWKYSRCLMHVCWLSRGGNPVPPQEQAYSLLWSTPVSEPSCPQYPYLVFWWGLWVQMKSGIPEFAFPSGSLSAASSSRSLSGLEGAEPFGMCVPRTWLWFWEFGSVMVWMWTVPHKFLCLNIWFPVRVALFQEVEDPLGGRTCVEGVSYWRLSSGLASMYFILLGLLR